MRTFILYSNATTGVFSLNGLPSSGRRMDLVARCVNAALWLSHDIREDVRLYVVLNGPPLAPKTIEFRGSSLRGVSPDERNIASWILKANEKHLEDGDWVDVQEGISVAKRSLEEVLAEVGGTPVMLDENGRDIREAELPGDAVFILGDHEGVPDDVVNLLDDNGVERISVGPETYLGSHCITLVNNELDRRSI